MCQKLFIIVGTICFGFWISTLVILAPKKAQKNSNFGPADNKNAIETHLQAILRPQKSMGGIIIDIWEKSFFLGHLDHYRCQKREFFTLMVGLINTSLKVINCLIVVKQ